MDQQTTNAPGKAGGSARRITIDPITRLEGHGKIDIFLDDQGAVERAFFQVPELRGFEKFAVGRPVEDMPQITSRICGVCPTAHHMAATKALDDLYQVDPPRAAKKIRELVYSTFMVEDHALHIYYLGGPDFVVGPTAPAAERNVLGVIAKVGVETGRRVIETRRRLRDLISLAGRQGRATRCSACRAASPSASPPKTRRNSSTSRTRRWSSGSSRCRSSSTSC